MVAVAWTETTVSALVTTAVPVQFTFQIMDSNGRFALAGLDALNIIGVLQNKPTVFSGSGANKVGLVVHGGGSKLLVDADSVDIVAGDILMSDATGKGIKATIATSNAVAIALEGATADNEIISVLLLRGKIDA